MKIRLSDEEAEGAMSPRIFGLEPPLSLTSIACKLLESFVKETIMDQISGVALTVCELFLPRDARSASAVLLS